MADNEVCDDGNTEDGDCCSSTCQYEVVGTICDDGYCYNGKTNGQCNSFGYCVGSQTSQTGECKIFLSSGSYKGDMGGLSGADAICQRLADDEGLAGVYRAWLSDSNSSASDRLTHSNVPYVDVLDRRIADNWTDLVDGSDLITAISVSEGGYDWYNICANCFWVPGGCGSTWTGTGPDGTQELGNCNNWTSGDLNSRGTAGIYCTEDTTWTRYASGTAVDCAHERSLYCFQQ